MRLKPSYLFFSAAVLGFVLSLTSCKDDDKCQAGSGGNLTIVAQLAHHGDVIPNDSLYPDTVWVKFNVSDWGNAPAGYDLRFIGEFPEDHVHLDGLKCGKYYLYGSGWDSSINMAVKGGKPFETDQQDGELNTTIPVVE